MVALNGTNFFFSKIMDHGEKEREKHDLALEKIQSVRDELNNGSIKYLTLILSKKAD